MIVGTSLSIQLAAALAHDLFDRLGPVGASAVRFALGAVILLAIVRPAIRGRDAATWGAIAAYGAALAALNLTFFQAISLIPMGIAVTLSFIAPLVMALVGSRRRRDVFWALLAGAGVATLGGIDRPGSVSGVLFAIAAGCAWVGVAYAGRSVGRRTRRVDGLALAIPIAALITVPLGIGHAGAIDVRSLAIGLVIAVGGLILPFALELEGLRRLEPRIVAVIYSVDPAIAAVIGFLALGERLTALQVIALVAVMIASAGATAAAADVEAKPPLHARHRTPLRPRGGPPVLSSSTGREQEESGRTSCLPPSR
jgi:inner membrane transporter RhtA